MNSCSFQIGCGEFVRHLMVVAVLPWSLSGLVAPLNGLQETPSAAENSATELEPEFEPLFDGQTLAGWTNPYEWGEATVVDGEIHLVANKKFFLVTERRFADFILEAEVCLPAEGPANSGIMFRCHVEPNKVFGYQAEVDPTERAWSGGLYDEGRRAWLFPINEQKGQVRLIQAPRGEWLRYRIECRGNHLRIFINDGLVTDWHDDTDAEGHIGLQHHGEAGQVYRFRNVRIQAVRMPENG
jgi:Domain of Unknown Function (DUF1080)